MATRIIGAKDFEKAIAKMVIEPQKKVYEFMDGKGVVKLIKRQGLATTRRYAAPFVPERLGSIKASGISRNVRIYTNDPVVIYNEYGTGTIGEANAHPDASMIGWEYDAHNHGNRGWWYPTDESDPNPMKRVKDGQLEGWTRGLPAGRFFADAREDLKSELGTEIGYKINGILERKGDFFYGDFEE